MAPSFQFLPLEVAEMEVVSNQLNNAAIPGRAILQALADGFNASPDRAGTNIPVHLSQVLIWYENRCRQAPETAKPPKYSTALPQLSGSRQMHRGDSSAPRTLGADLNSSSGLASLLSVGLMAPPVAMSEASINDLDEGTVSKILLSLPSQASLAVASAVCKPWLSICTSAEFLHHYHRHLTGAGPLLGLLLSTGPSKELRMIRSDGVDSRPHLAVTLRNMDRAILELTRYRRYLDLWILDYHGGWFLLKSLKYNRLFVYNLLTGQHNELPWPRQEVFTDRMIGFVIDGGNVIFLRKPIMGQSLRGDCHIYSVNVRSWHLGDPPCQEADAERYEICRYGIVWKQRAGNVVYTLCGNYNVGYCLAALDMRSMSYSITDLPSCLRHSYLMSRMRVMEMGNPESIGLVAVSDAPNFTVRSWLLNRRKQNAVAAAGEGQGWAAYNPVELQGLASKLAVKLLMVKVVAAYAGVAHLWLAALAKVQNQSFYSCYLASLDLSSQDFTNVQPVESGWNDKMYPFFLPWRRPFLPPPGDTV